MSVSSPEKVAEVVRLASALADQVLDAQIMKREIPAEQITALLATAQFMQEHELPWPPLMAQVVHEFADRVEAAGSKPDQAERAGVVAGLTRFLGAFRRENGVSPEP